jgi:zinc/manganese transport system substrate-binding protein
MKYVVVTAGVLVFALSAGPAATAEKPLNVVATLSTFADLVKTIGGRHVEVSSVASPKFNPHFIEPKPSDVLKVKEAELFVHAGLDLEAWRGPLVDAAGNPDVRPGGSRELDLSRGIPLLEVPDRPVSRSQGDIHIFGNPHYWVDPENGKRMAKSISERLSAMDPDHREDYERNLADFENRLNVKIPEWKSKMRPFEGAELIGYHNEWPYLMQFLGLKMDKFLEPKPGIPPTPKQAEYLQQYMAEKGIKVIVQTSYFPTKAAQTLAKRTGGQAVLLCQAVGEMPEAADFIGMIDYDVNTLAKALQQR